MAFYNDKGYIINDSLSNVHVILESKNFIKLYTFNAEKNKSKETILVEEKINEFDVTIDNNDIMYLVYQTVDGSLWLLTINNGEINKSILIEGPVQRMYNLNIFIGDDINIIYCVPSEKTKDEYRILHHCYNGEEWQTLEVGNIKVREIINEFAIVKSENNIILTYYNVKDNYEQIYIKAFDLIDKKWGKSIQLTNSQNNKLYLDIFIKPQNLLHLVYSEYDGGNLHIKYCKFEICENKILLKSESYLSDPCNCSYPTFIFEEEKLWIVWTEYNHLISLYSLDYGDTWSKTYHWSESEKYDFLRYKFLSNNKNVNKFYKFNYSFGKVYPEISFIGFGNLEKAKEQNTKINNSIKDDVNNQEKDIITRSKENFNNEINQIKRSIREINDQINKLINSKDSNKNNENKEIIYKKMEEIEKVTAELNKLEVRVRNIEDFLDRKTRGLFYRSRRL